MSQRRWFSKAQHRPRQNHAGIEHMNDGTEAKIPRQRGSRGDTRGKSGRGIREAMEERRSGIGCRRSELKNQAWDTVPETTQEGHSGIKKGKHRMRRYFIKQCLEEDDENQVIQILTSNIQDLEKLMCSEDMSSTDTVKLLQILAKVVDSGLHREGVLKILNIVCSSRFIDTHIQNVILEFDDYGDIFDNNLNEILWWVHKLLSNVCRKVPSFTGKTYLLLKSIDDSDSIASVMESNDDLEDAFNDLLNECDRCRRLQRKDTAHKNGRRSEINDDDKIPPEDINQLSIFPGDKDMDLNEQPFLRANKTKGAFIDPSHYLDVQFRLLREDYIRPLRDGIGEYRRLREKGENMKTYKDMNIRLYNRVQIIGIVCKDSIEHRIQFDNTPFKSMRWQSSKRLLYGSLVCLSADLFQTIYYAVVTSREVKDLEKGIIRVRFESGLEEILDKTQRDMFTMAETTAYFEAYRHVLEGLQEMKSDLPLEEKEASDEEVDFKTMDMVFPFARYIIKCSQTIKPPAYLTRSGKAAKMNLNTILGEGKQHTASVNMINPRSWPVLKNTVFDASQYDAVKTALTKEIAIIQGPPGTGKTFVGLKVAQVLLDNKNVWNERGDSRPILIVCYTNHALDQFLEGILEFCPNGIVRVGSRCQTPSLEKFNLKRLRADVRKRKRVDSSLFKSIRDCCAEIRKLRNNVDAISAKVEATTKGVVSENSLESCINYKHYCSLKKGASTLESGRSSTVMMEWLSAGLPTMNYDSHDYYIRLAQEVTSHILDVSDAYSDEGLDVGALHSLHPKMRAQIYRFWLEKILKIMELKADEAIRNGDDPQTFLALQDAAKREILPDQILQPVMRKQIYLAILSSNNTTVNWSTVSLVFSATSKDWPLLASNIQEREPNVSVSNPIQWPSESNNTPKQEPNPPNYTSIQWPTVSKQGSNVSSNAANQGSNSTSNATNQGSNSTSNAANQGSNSTSNAANQDSGVPNKTPNEGYTYNVKAWLGIPENSLNVQMLQEVLELLLEEDKDNAGDDADELNIEEEADVLQRERQLDDDDDVDDFLECDRRSHKYSINDAMTELGVITVISKSNNPAGGWSMTSQQRKQQTRRIMRMLKSSTPMASDDADSVKDVWELAMNDRVRLYLFWLQRYQDQLKSDLNEEVKKYEIEARRLRELRFAEDRDILLRAKFIGMTTTGAARYRRVLKDVGCPIVLLEEAAEVLEAHVVTTLHKTCQHLILIGDHQQLRPSPTVYELCHHYHLDISLFERLVKNELPHTTLAVQHRMRPEISRLVQNIYPHLQDHDVTLNRENIRGVKSNVFLLHHEFEERSNSETSSKANDQEAKLCVRLCRYFLQQGYPSTAITILTAYSGQLFALKMVMKAYDKFFQGNELSALNKLRRILTRKAPSMPLPNYEEILAVVCPCCQDVRVTTIDNYQGEENDIIILSLVRNNEEGQVGFLSTDNRVCVAISRARNGLYALGNFRILKDRSDLWRKLCATAKEHKQIGKVLMLRCENHPEMETKVMCVKDFDNAPEGGCTKPCTFRLEGCGHVCERQCHGYDRDHAEYLCKKKCEKIVCNAGHPCKKKCHQPCGKCQFKVLKVVPMCKHEVSMPCSQDPHSWRCENRCKGVLPCGHQCTGKCFDCRNKSTHVDTCTEQVERMWPCGHLVTSSCAVAPGKLPCTQRCTAKLDCGHECSGSCGECLGGRVHKACTVICGKPLPGCSHVCSLTCGAICTPCEKKCSSSCQHSQCSQPCGVPCSPCREPCPWKCSHKTCSAQCINSCDPCPNLCQKMLSCKHQCSGFCGEACVCYICETAQIVPLYIQSNISVLKNLTIDKGTALVKLPQCGHIYRADVFDDYVTRSLLKLGCSEHLPCPYNCPTYVRDWDCWRYQKLLRARHEQLQDTKASFVATTTLPDRQRRKVKIEESLKYLKHDAEGEKSFASKAWVDAMVKDLNVNSAFALTNQIKMMWVTEGIEYLNETCVDLDTRLKQSPDRDQDVLALQKVLLQPVNVMTQQRHRELMNELRPLAYASLLRRAKSWYRSKADIKVINSHIEALISKTHDNLPDPTMVKILRHLKKQCFKDIEDNPQLIYVFYMESMLEATPDTDLADIMGDSSILMRLFHDA